MANNSRIIVTGVKELEKALRDAGPLAEKALASAMFEEQSAIIAAAQAVTPVDTGTLRASGTVLAPDIQGSKVTVVAGFGGAAAKYAIVVHEKHSAKAKFLERPFLERAPKIPMNLAKRVERAWRRLAI